jgi:hypothetical protein
VAVAHILDAGRTTAKKAKGKKTTKVKQ